ncbi:MAG: acetate--CoA ligase family protein [Candidatus Diapherotrites archaeon]|nr:acetate--CoA ligase family protein [Candidatus Diapherotrites archaeon]
MDMDTAFKLLEDYGIPVAKYGRVRSSKAAARFAKGMYPVVLKVDSPDIIHKTDRGVVATDVRDEKALCQAFDRITRKAGNARVRGVIVQEHVSGEEVMVGAKRDPQFGSVVLFSLGGVFVEVLKDFAVRVTPITRADAEGMVREVRGYPVLAGARGRKPVDIDALVKVILAVSKIMDGNPSIKELDVNPLFASEDGVKAVDVRVIE